jgi:hypothetical protein
MTITYTLPQRSPVLESEFYSFDPSLRLLLLCLSYVKVARAREASFQFESAFLVNQLLRDSLIVREWIYNLFHKFQKKEQEQKEGLIYFQ